MRRQTKVYAVSPRVVRLVRRLQRKLRAAPKRYEQAFFVEKKPHCGTVCCLAGHLTEMHPKFKGWEMEHADDGTLYPTEDALIGTGTRSACDVAREMLEITDANFPNLFEGNPSAGDWRDGNPWPAPFAADWAKAKTNRARVDVACRRLDHFLETGA